MEKKAKFEQINTDFQSSYRYVASTKNYREEISLHFHPEFEILHIEKGSGKRMVGDFIESFHEGEVIFMPPSLPHCWIFDPASCGPDEQCKVVFVQFKSSLLEKGLGFFEEWINLAGRIKSIQRALRITGPAAQSIKNGLLEMKRQNGIERLQSLFSILASLEQQQHHNVIGPQQNIPASINKSMKRMQLVLKHIMENYSQRITLEDISKVASMNPSAFSNFFRKETGKTFTSYVNEYRLEMVCSMLLASPEKKINEAAWKCGFFDVNHFNRSFKKIKGQSPHRWRTGALQAL